MSAKISDLLPFDAASLCPKCGHDNVNTVYWKNAHCSHYPDYCVLSKLTEPACCEAEHFHRSCQRCRYWWVERVLECPPRRALPDPEEPGIGVDERVRRIGMALNAELHPDYTDRELRMLDDLGSLVGWTRRVLPVLRRHGISYPLLADDLQRIEAEFGPWNES